LDARLNGEQMNSMKFSWIAQVLALSILWSLSLSSAAESAKSHDKNYEISNAAYINSPQGSLEAQCLPGDELVEGSCEGSYRGISPQTAEKEFPNISYPLETESLTAGYRCRPRLLRPDQLLMVIVEVTCKPGKTARLARVN